MAHLAYAFTKFTDQQRQVLNNAGALLNLTHGAIQVVYCHYMLAPFMECFWYVKF